MGWLNLPDFLREPRCEICPWAGLFILQIATWDLGLWLLSRTYALSQLSISEGWNLQPPGKDAAHMTIFYISLPSCACPCYKVKVTGMLTGGVERETSLGSSLCVFSLTWARKLWPCSPPWTNRTAVTYSNGRTDQVLCKRRWSLRLTLLHWNRGSGVCPAAV